MNKLRGTIFCCSRARAGRRAAVLLEVLLAMMLFVLSAGVILGAVQASINSVRRIRLQARAANLAVTLLSEIQMGLAERKDEGPTAYEEPLQDWTWQVITEDLTEPADAPPLLRVSVIVENPGEGFSYRLVQLFPDDGPADLSDEDYDEEVPGLEREGRP